MDSLTSVEIAQQLSQEELMKLIAVVNEQYARDFQILKVWRPAKGVVTVDIQLAGSGRRTVNL